MKVCGKKISAFVVGKLSKEVLVLGGGRDSYFLSSKITNILLA